LLPGARLIILGRQGAGKGTQCTSLSRHYVVPHVSTGDILRAAVSEGTELGLQAKAIMDAGGLVGDDIMIGIVDGRLSRTDAMTRGYILDGFPRTVAQARALADITSSKPIDVVIDLEVPRQLVLARIASRRVCNVCGHNYSTTGEERQPWVCDFCGGDVLQRADDHPDAVNRRLDLYESQTKPLIDHYRGLEQLVIVDGVGPKEEVFHRLVATIEARRARQRR
jgi:adenylate kinase